MLRININLSNGDDHNDDDDDDDDENDNNKFLGYNRQLSLN
jgi:hypothetical protein